jgi:exonuclease III
MKIRIVSWNMNVRARPDQWDILQAIDPDIALLQEWRKPSNFKTDGYLYSKEYLPGRHTAIWSKWSLQDKNNFPKAAEAPWESYRSALEGCIVSASAITPIGPISVSSVYAYPEKIKHEQLTGFDLETLRLPSSKGIWPADLIWWALKDWVSSSGRAILGGDWNTSRILDDPKPRGNQEFFNRMQDCGWDEIARNYYPDEKDSFTWTRKNARSMQLDHFFASSELASSAVNFEVTRTESFNQASDHFPIHIDLELNK